jgi:hypothetical protein
VQLADQPLLFFDQGVQDFQPLLTRHARNGMPASFNPSLNKFVGHSRFLPFWRLRFRLRPLLWGNQKVRQGVTDSPVIDV